MIYALLLGMCAWLAVYAVRAGRKLDALREQLRADTRATMRQIRRRHAAGVRGWQTRRAGV